MSKYPYKHIYISVAEAESLGLPRRISGKTTREDGRIFQNYYYRVRKDRGYKSEPLELWVNSNTLKMFKERKKKNKQKTMVITNFYIIRVLYIINSIKNAKKSVFRANRR